MQILACFQFDVTPFDLCVVVLQLLPLPQSYPVSPDDPEIQRARNLAKVNTFCSKHVRSDSGGGSEAVTVAVASS